jgi:pilus assembly protein CpaB
MNRTKLLFVGLVALVLSGLVTYVIYLELSARLVPTVEDPDQIVVAVEKLQLGTLLETHHLRTAPWPKGVEIEGSFGTVEEVLGRGVVVPVLPNEPVLESKLAPREAGAGLTSAIPQGMRAVAVKVNDVVGVAGFVLPGTRVDVIVTGTPAGEKNRQVSKVILENVQVLAAGQNVEQDARGEPKSVQVITLLVSPKDSQKLALASLEGDIRLALRNPLDLDQTDPAPFISNALYFNPSSQAAPPKVVRAVRKKVIKPKPVAPPKEPVVEHHVVELIQGGERANHSFQKSVSKPSRSSSGS